MPGPGVPSPGRSALGGCLVQGVPGPVGGAAPRGAGPGGAWSGEVPGPGGSAPRGELVSQHALRQTPPGR